MKRKNIQRFSVAAATGGTRQFAVDTEIMDYVEPARAFGAGDLAADTSSTRYQPRLIAVPDLRSEPLGPLVLALGRNRRLGLVRRSNGNSTAWEQIDLSSQFPDQKAEVLAFGAAAAPGADLVTVAVALRLAGQPARSRILVAYDVSTEHADWRALSWVDYGPARIAVDGIRVWRDASGIWMIALSGSDGRHQRPYLIRSDRPRSFDEGALVFSPAADLAHILDYRAGAWQDDASSGAGTMLHVLGDDDGGGRLLSARPIAFDAAGQPQITPAYLFGCEADSRVLALGRDPDPARADDTRPGADLYVGGRGIKRLAGDEFTYQEEAEWETVVPSTLPSPVRRLLVADADEGDVTLWALLENEQLVAVHRPGPDADWGSPLFLRKGVIDIAPSAGDEHVSASVLLVYRAGDAAHLWRDRDGLWQEAVIHTPDPADAIHVTCFGTTLTAYDADGAPLPLAPVTIRASAPSSLVINGEHHYVGPDLAVTVPTGPTGSLVVFNRATSLAPASYRFELEDLAQAIDVNPGSVLHQRLAAISVEELRAAKVPGGAPLLAAAYRGTGQGTTLEAMVTAMRKAAELARANDGKVAGVRLGPADGPFISDISDVSDVSAANVGDAYGWGVTIGADGTLAPIASLAAAMPAGGAQPFAGDSLSDHFEGILTVIGGSASYAVRNANGLIELVCEIGGRMTRWVLETLEQLATFLGYLIDSICTSIGDFLDYMKFLFDWNDIKTVRALMADLARQRLHDLRNQVGALKNATADTFDDLLAAVQSQARAWDITPSTRIGAAPVPRPAITDPAIRDRTADDVLASGPGGWALDQLTKLGNQLIDIDANPEFESGTASATLLEELVTRMDALCADLGADARRIFGDRPCKLTDIDLDKLQRLTLAVTIRVAEQGTLVLKAAALKLLELLDDVLSMYGQLLFATVRFPFLEKLDKIMLSSGTASLLRPPSSSSFQVADILLLIPSVLTTIACKAIAGPRLAVALAQYRTAAPATQATAFASAAGAGGVLDWASDRYHDANAFIQSKEGILIKQVGVCIVDFVMVVWKSFDAAKEFEIPGPATALGKIKLLATCAYSVLYESTSVLANRAAGPVAVGADLAVYLCGAMQAVTEAHKVLAGPKISKETFENFSAGVEGTQVLCHMLKAVFKSVSYAWQDEDKRDGWALFIFWGSASSKALVQGARLIKEPETKALTAATGICINLGFALSPGIYRAKTTYLASSAVPASLQG